MERLKGLIAQCLASIKNKRLKQLLEHGVYLIILLVLIPLFFYFEIVIVLPVVVADNSTAYLVHMFLASFCLVNVVGNMIFGMFTDTSLKGRELFANCDTTEWTICTTCESARPPRSWHCDICNICILRRDHHCTYFASCVGYFNYRYFLMFVLHIFISMMYAFYFNVIFISQTLQWNHGLTILKFFFPLANFAWDINNYENIYILLVVINVIAGIFTGFLFFYHLYNALHGQTTPESKQQQNTFAYDCGWKRNLMDVLGSNWYLTWVCPFIRSPLPGNGMSWDFTLENKVL